MSSLNQTGFAYATAAALGYALDAVAVGVDTEQGQRYVGFTNECLDRAARDMADSAAEYEVVQHMRELVAALRTPGHEHVFTGKTQTHDICDECGACDETA